MRSEGCGWRAAMPNFLGNVYFTLFAEPRGTMKLWRIREYWREDFPGEE